MHSRAESVGRAYTPPGNRLDEHALLLAGGTVGMHSLRRRPGALTREASVPIVSNKFYIRYLRPVFLLIVSNIFYAKDPIPSKVLLTIP